jgi:hypothetical protein
MRGNRAFRDQSKTSMAKHAPGGGHRDCDLSERNNYNQECAQRSRQRSRFRLLMVQQLLGVNAKETPPNFCPRFEGAQYSVLAGFAG